MDTNTVVSILLMIILIVVVFAARFYVGRFMVKRAVSQVVGIFRKHNAMNAANARTLDEMGLGRRGVLQRAGNVTRDYKEQALRAMMEADVVRTAEGDRVYLAEYKLAEYDL